MFKISLKAARVNAGLNQTEAAKMLNISVSSLNSWESGETEPKFSQIKRLCEIYNIPFDNLSICN